MTNTALGKDKIAELIDTYYRAFFTSLSEATDTDYSVETYTEQQATPGFRAEFLRSLERLEDVRWWMAPSHGVIHVRLPCPQCGWAEKRGDRTKLLHLDEDGAVCTAVCLDHGRHQAHVDPEDDQPYLDLATLYRNLVKERSLGRDVATLHVMMKGGDWAFGCQLVDGALGAPATPASQMPIRIFTPQVLAVTGAKLSKSLLREHGQDALPVDVAPWMLDTTVWPRSVDDYVDALVWLVSELLTDPEHFFRSFAVKELGRLMNSRPADLATRPRAHEMGIYKRYFDLIAAGRKTTEIRVNGLQPPQDQGRLSHPLQVPRRRSADPSHEGGTLLNLRGDVRPARSADRRRIIGCIHFNVGLVDRVSGLQRIAFENLRPGLPSASTTSVISAAMMTLPLCENTM